MVVGDGAPHFKLVLNNNVCDTNLGLDPQSDTQLPYIESYSRLKRYSEVRLRYNVIIRWWIFFNGSYCRYFVSGLVDRDSTRSKSCSFSLVEKDQAI